MKIILFISFIALTVSSTLKVQDLLNDYSSLKESFKAFHKIFNKQSEYSLNSLEGIRRYKIYKENVKMIRNENTINSDLKMEINELADKTKDEIIKSIGEIPSSGINFGNLQQNSDNDFEFSTVGEIDHTLAFLPQRYFKGNKTRCDETGQNNIAQIAEFYFWKNTGRKEYFSPQQITDCYNENLNKSKKCFSDSIWHICLKRISQKFNLEKDYPLNPVLTLQNCTNNVSQNKTLEGASLQKFTYLTRPSYEQFFHFFKQAPLIVKYPCSIKIWYYSSGVVKLSDSDVLGTCGDWVISKFSYDIASSTYVIYGRDIYSNKTIPIAVNESNSANSNGLLFNEAYFLDFNYEQAQQ